MRSLIFWLRTKFKKRIVDESYVIFCQRVALFTLEEQEFVYTGGKKGEPVELTTRLMYFDLMDLSTSDANNNR